MRQPETRSPQNTAILPSAGKGKKRIVLITTGQPAINPRIVKEADSLVAAGYDVNVLYCYYIEWAQQMEQQWLPVVGWKHYLIGGRPGQKTLQYLYTRLRFKCARLLNRHLNPALLPERAMARAYDELLRAAKSLKADMYIGHNLGALPVAVNAAKFHGAKAGFDFEDYHRGEFAPKDKNLQRVRLIEDRYVQSLDYFSGSSEPIVREVEQDHPGFTGKMITVLNCFPLSQQPAFQPRLQNENSLRLFWFSQTVGKNRGLETVVAALAQINHPAVHLTLAGQCSKQMKDYLQNIAGSTISRLEFAGIVPPTALPSFAAIFDVGLATEIGEPANRDLCLTNKLYTYLLSGLVVLASDTTAQRLFQATCPEACLLYRRNDVESFKSIIISLLQSPDALALRRMKAYAVAQKVYNWDSQSQKFCELIHSLVPLV